MTPPEVTMTPEHRPAPEAIAELLAQFTKASNEHDLDAVMSFFAEDCTYLASSGPDKDGAVHRGRDVIRAALAAGLADFPDGRYVEVSSFALGDRAALQWTFVGTSDKTGEAVAIRGCDLFQFEHGKIKMKDAFRKEKR